MSTVNDEEFGQLERTDDRSIVRYTRHLHHPPEKVWRALTEPEELAAWFPTTIEGELRPGSALQFAFREVAIDPMPGELVAIDPPRLLEFLWGDDLLRFELQPEGTGTVLDFVVTMVEHGKAARDGAGWHVCLDRLALAVDGMTPSEEEADQWRVVHPHYVQRMGPEASTLGPPQEWEDVHGPADDQAG